MGTTPFQTTNPLDRTPVAFVRSTRVKLNGSFPVPPIPETTAVAFWKRVCKTETCWFWTGAKRSTSGYGVLRVPIDTAYGRAALGVAAHKLSYVLTNGPIPIGKILLHSCDEPACVRPDHLRPGTHRENAEDFFGKRPAKDRNPHWAAKLTSDEEIKRLRDLYFQANMTVGALARQFGMSKPGVIAVLTGQSHRGAPGPTGEIRKVRGPQVFGAKLDEQRVGQLRQRYVEGETIYELAKAFAVAPQTISKIIRNKVWKHVEPVPEEMLASGHRKLAKQQVMRIRQRHGKGVGQARLAKDYQVSRAAISLIVNRKVHR